MPQVETNGSEQQRERNGRGDDEGAANIAEEQEQNERDQDHSFGKIVQHGVRGEVDERAAIEEGNNFYAAGAGCGR